MPRYIPLNPPASDSPSTIPTHARLLACDFSNSCRLILDGGPGQSDSAKVALIPTSQNLCSMQL